MTLIVVGACALQPDAGSESTQAGATTVATTETSAAHVSECGTNGALIVPEGIQVHQFRELELSAQTIIDAREASWTDVDDYPIRLSGGEGVCWEGGEIVGTYPDTDSWDRMHDTAAFSILLPRFVGVDIEVHNYGDAINIVDNASDFVLRGLHLSFIRDDCIENDRLNGGLLEDSLLDGCYTAFSARPNPSDTESDGSDVVWTIRRSLVRLQPMPTVYKGPVPGHGQFFKWDKTGRGPHLELHDNVFLVEQPPNSGDLGVPEGLVLDCSNNVVVWLGQGDYPAPLPDCFTVTNDRSIWDEAVADWVDRHEVAG